MNNKNTLIVLIFCLFTCLLQAQDTIHYFNKTFNPAPDTTNLLVNGALAVEDGYIVVGGYTSLNDKAVFIAKFNWQGDTIWFKIIDNSYTVGNIVLGTELIRTHDGNCVLTYSKLLSMSKDIKLVKFTPDGTILWNKTYGDYANEEIYQVIETDDGGFALFGATQYPDDTTKYFLMKIKPDTDEDWTAMYMLDSSSLGLSIQQTADHGFIMGGYARSYETNYDTYIVKTNSAGAVQWATNFGEEFGDCGGGVNLLANNQYLITTCDHASNNDIDTHLRFTKLDSTGQIIWDSIYYNLQALTYSELPLIFLSDSSFVTVLSFRSEITGRRSNWFTHFSLQGDILSQREYTSNPNESVYIKDIRPTPDGGYILAGYEYTSTPQKGYLVKVDSLGNSCSVVGCDSVGYVYAVGINTQTQLPPPSEGARGRLFVFPNPAKDYAQVICSQATIPNAKLLVYDLNGRLLQTTTSTDSVTFSINTSLLPTGIYYCRIENTPYTTKLIVVK